ncbi:MAG: TetR family transcriptional regulator [Lachnospiraceae bacterium]|nr:TetR family transcriptional regulator [Lachnospiraceae bacterium]
MSNLTSRAIKETFTKMLEDKPLSQITVKDIVKECGINRNSFYYHFQDMPALIEEIIKEDADTAIAAFPHIESIEEVLEVALSFAYEKKKSVLHIFNSVNRDIFESHLMDICEYAVTNYINSVISGRKVKPEAKALLIQLVKCLCFGEVIDWLSHGMKEDLREPFHQLCELNKGHIEEIILNSLEE